jgi:hypothetical protein
VDIAGTPRCSRFSVKMLEYDVEPRNPGLKLEVQSQLINVSDNFKRVEGQGGKEDLKVQIICGRL